MQVTLSSPLYHELKHLAAADGVSLTCRVAQVVRAYVAQEALARGWVQSGATRTVYSGDGELVSAVTYRLSPSGEVLMHSLEGEI